MASPNNPLLWIIIGIASVAIILNDTGIGVSGQTTPAPTNGTTTTAPPNTTTTAPNATTTAPNATTAAPNGSSTTPAPGPPPWVDDHEFLKVVELTDFSNCRWTVDLAQTDSPNKLSKNYFNERGSSDQKDKLLRPRTHHYLQEVTQVGAKGFFVFPYFLIIRADCDGGNYDEAFYRLFMHGGYPHIEIQHWPMTSRDVFSNSLKGTFRSALVNLTRGEDTRNRTLLPLNELENVAPNMEGCHWKMCYPGFAVPLLLYRIPSFEVTVNPQDVFNRLFMKIYVSSFNNRDTEGSGTLTVATQDADPVEPKKLFPKDRLDETLDNDFRDIQNCSMCSNAGYCPHVAPQPDDGINDEEFAPLDGDDFFAPQFTYLTTPTIGLAGFYDPSLVIIGDPDLHSFEAVEWTKNDPTTNVSIFSGILPGNNLQVFRCVDSLRHVGNGTEAKIMYSQLDDTDAEFPIKYYRTRYKEMSHAFMLNTSAIYEIIALEDRFLLITARGLVQFYGNTNATNENTNFFKAYQSDNVAHCFKFVRIPRRALMENDIIVGITYHYQQEASGVKIPINQHIYVGRLTVPGHKIEMTQLMSKDTSDVDEDVQYVIPEDPSSGETATLDPNAGAIPIRELEENADSEIDRICYKAIREKMPNTKNEITIPAESSKKWCEAIDAIPHTLLVDTFLVLVRMYILFPDRSANPIPKPGDEEDGQLRVYFYIIASHTLQPNRDAVDWRILSIIPRIPCIDEHKESVRNVYLFDLDYFTKTQGTIVGCHAFNDNFDDFVYLTSITFTRMLSNHLFVYGSRILQSIDGGETFVSLVSFPNSEKFDIATTCPSDTSPETCTTIQNATLCKETKRKQRWHLKHRIMVMAFDDQGRYAFLTNRRELWIGTTGNLNQIRLRPSEGYSMTQSIMSKVIGLNDAVPFTLIYDAQNRLHELVAVTDKDGEVSRVMRRRVSISLILRNRHFLNKLKVETTALKSRLDIAGNTDEDSHVAYDDPGKWILYCPFSSLTTRENYSSIHSRNQMFYFTPPRQHPDFGRPLQNSALWAFQVSTYSITTLSFFNMKTEAYARSRIDPDPFVRWVAEKETQSTIGLLRFLRGDKDNDGILVIPTKNRRLSTQAAASRIFRFYYMDYDMTLRLEISFSIKNDANLGTTDYFTQQISQIQINVDNGNGSLLRIDTERVPLADTASVLFIVHISVIKQADLIQNLPGQHFVPVPVLFHLIGGFGRCIRRSSDPRTTDLHSTLIYVGCQPATDLLFDWNRTLFSIKFRNKDKHFGREDECYGNEFVCFFARTPLVLFFEVFDVAKQRYTSYKGNYTMRIVSGAYTEAELGDVENGKPRYTKEEQEAYNIPEVSDVSLIWNEWDLEKGEKVDRKGQGPGSRREPVLTAGISAIQWACHTLSPCARITPTNWKFETVYWFRIQISNRGVEKNTLCLFEKEFNILLYGFPPSPEIQLLTTIVFCLCMLGILYLLFFCCRGHKRVWRASKVKMYGWYQIVRDTFPKSLKTHDAEGPAEGRTQQQKDNIILSLQGHLKIPPLLPRGSEDPDRDRDRAGSIAADGSSLNSRRSSAFSMASHVSSSSSRSRQDALSPVAARNAATTWTDLVYEQIISKRLAAIVEKNRKMRANIMRKASVHLDSGFEHEKRYEREHKHTISEEFFHGPSPGPSKK